MTESGLVFPKRVERVLNPGRACGSRRNRELARRFFQEPPKKKSHGRTLKIALFCFWAVCYIASLVLPYFPVTEEVIIWGEDGAYYGEYFGQIAHQFDKPIFKTCKAPVTATTDSDPPTPPLRDEFMATFREFLEAFVIGLVCLWWSDIVTISDIHKGITFIVKMVFTTLKCSFIRSADFATFYVMVICKQIRRKLGLPAL